MPRDDCAAPSGGPSGWGRSPAHAIRAPSVNLISGVLPEKARLDTAGAIKVNLRETCIRGFEVRRPQGCTARRPERRGSGTLSASPPSRMRCPPPPAFGCPPSDHLSGTGVHGATMTYQALGWLADALGRLAEVLGWPPPGWLGQMVDARLSLPAIGAEQVTTAPQVSCDVRVGGDPWALAVRAGPAEAHLRPRLQAV